jgi:hypothetical protein
MGRATMPELAQVLKLFGFTTPLIYAAATYGFFHWLDKKASGPAKRAISSWLEPREYDREAVRAAILEVFDRVYSRPLLAWRAFFRSAVITLVVLILFIYEFAPSPLDITWRFYYTETVVLGIFSNIFSDYTALFAIRRMLNRNRLSPFKAMLVGPLVGICIVLLVASLLAMLVLGLWYIGLVLPPPKQVQVQPGFQSGYGVLQRSMSAASLFVHLWLPFFALCVGLLKGLNYVLLATKQVQWFLKQGRQHPLDALGLVAAPLVFLGAVVVQMLVSK